MTTTIVLILLVIVVLLASPLEIAFDIQHDGTSRTNVALLVLFSTITIPLSGRSDHRHRDTTRKKAKKKKKKKTQQGGSKAMQLLRNAGFRQRLLKFVRRLFRSIRINTLDVQVRLGLDDPADTGRLWGILGPLSSFLADIRRANIRIEPDFATEVMSLQSRGRIGIIPLQVLSISLLFFLSPQVIRAIAFKP